jgi:hypothetical protein
MEGVLYCIWCLEKEGDVARGHQETCPSPSLVARVVPELEPQDCVSPASQPQSCSCLVSRNIQLRLDVLTNINCRGEAEDKEGRRRRKRKRSEGRLGVQSCTYMSSTTVDSSRAGR